MVNLPCGNSGENRVIDSFLCMECTKKGGINCENCANFRGFCCYHDCKQGHKENVAEIEKCYNELKPPAPEEDNLDYLKILTEEYI